MIKLSDTQLVILSAACQRPGRNLLPLPVRIKGGAAQKIVASLLAKALIEEVAAGPADPVWRDGEDGRETTLRATDAAFVALGIEVESRSGTDRNEAGEEAASAAAQSPRERSRKAGIKPQAADASADDKAARHSGHGEPRPAPRQPRANTKQARLIAMLRRPDGASIEEIIASTGWQPHTVRGAISGALKKKLGLAVASDKVEGRGRVYRLVL